MTYKFVSSRIMFLLSSVSILSQMCFEFRKMITKV